MKCVGGGKKSKKNCLIRLDATKDILIRKDKIKKIRNNCLISINWKPILKTGKLILRSNNTFIASEGCITISIDDGKTIIHWYLKLTPQPVFLFFSFSS